MYIYIYTLSLYIYIAFCIRVRAHTLSRTSTFSLKHTNNFSRAHTISLYDDARPEHLVVKPEDEVVDGNLLPFQELPQRLEKAKHYYK